MLDSPSGWQGPLEPAVRDPQLALGASSGPCEYTLVYRKEADPHLYHGEGLGRLAECSDGPGDAGEDGAADGE